MFSGALEIEQNHPDYESVSQKSIEGFERIILFCQENGQLPPGSVGDLAIKLWSIVHGFTTLMLENQFPPQYLEQKDIKELLKKLVTD
jgi:hypothetical protein